MDKLKPILTHKFWIIAVVALLVPLVGWWMDTSSLSAQITARRNKIGEAFKNAEVPPDAPNDKWEAEVKKINAIQNDQLRKKTIELWELQKGMMIWPADLSGMSTVAYRGELQPASAMAFALDIFRSQYPFEVEKTRQVVKPFERGEGLVIFPKQAMAGLVADDKWKFSFPTKDEMWDAEEDQWHMRELLAAVAAVNGDATALHEAAIREIQLIEVRGGSLKESAAGGAAAPSGGGDAAAAPAAGGGGSQLIPIGASQGILSTAYALEEDVGKGEEAAAGAADAGGGGGATGAPAAPGGSGGGGPKKRRFVDPDESMPYRHRAFHLRLTMDHRKVPDLLIQLTNLRYPVTIIRVQQAAKMDDGDGSQRAAPGANPGAFGRAVFGGGGNRPNRPTGGIDGGRLKAGGDQGGDAAARTLIETAMSDPFLADVDVAGIMTVYQPPKETAAPVDAISAAPGAPATPAAATTPEASPEATPPEKPADTKPGDPATPDEKPVEPKPEGTPDKPGEKPAPPAKPSDPAKPAETEKPEPAGTEAVKPEPAKPGAAKPAGTPPAADPKPPTEPSKP